MKFYSAFWLCSGALELALALWFVHWIAKGLLMTKRRKQTNEVSRLIRGWAWLIRPLIRLFTQRK